MSKRLRLLSVVLPFAVSSLVAACRLPEVDARQRLEAEGLSEILLVKTDTGFAWTARGAGGAECRGTVTNAGDGDGTWRVERTCENPS